MRRPIVPSLPTQLVLPGAPYSAEVLSANTRQGPKSFPGAISSASLAPPSMTNEKRFKTTKRQSDAAGSDSVENPKLAEKKNRNRKKNETKKKSPEKGFLLF
jgi:hypothetical protein